MIVYIQIYQLLKKRRIKKMKKLLIIWMSCFSLISTFTINTLAQTDIGYLSSNSTKSVMLRSDILEWVYKSFNGKQYKRLWNATQARWITDWLPL